MSTEPDKTRHSFLAPARPFEPPVESDCTYRARGCAASERSSAHFGLDRRRRPFPRSLGLHQNSLAPTTRYENPGGTIRQGHDHTVPTDARRGAEHAVRLLLEVLDRRRPAEHMGKLFAPNVVESVKTIVRSQPPGLRLGAATLRQVHVTHAAPNAAEVFGTYTRGPRVFALAARLEYKSVSRTSRWIVTSLRVV